MKNPNVRRGAWSQEEDMLLRKCVDKYGEGKWHQVPLRAGLNRCRKSCRLRWLNYLHPRIKRGEFKEDEVDLIIKMHKLLKNRWSLIAGRLPGRTANDIKNYWNSHLRKKVEIIRAATGCEPKLHKCEVIRPQPMSLGANTQKLHKCEVIRPQPMTLGANTQKLRRPLVSEKQQPKQQNQARKQHNEQNSWWNDLLFEDESVPTPREKLLPNSNLGQRDEMNPNNCIFDDNDIVWDDDLLSMKAWMMD